MESLTHPVKIKLPMERYVTVMLNIFFFKDMCVCARRCSGATAEEACELPDRGAGN